MNEDANRTSSTSRGRQHLQRQGSSSFFDELLESGGEIEGLFQQKGKTDMQELRKVVKKPSLATDPLDALREQVALYNKKSGEVFKLRIIDEVGTKEPHTPLLGNILAYKHEKEIEVGCEFALLGLR